MLTLGGISVFFDSAHRSQPAPVTMPSPARRVADPQAAALCAHLKLHPDIASAEYLNTVAGAIEVTLRAGVSDAKTFDIARRIRRYLTRKYSTVDARVIGQVNIHQDARENAELDALNKVAGANDHQGRAAATVAQHIAGAPDLGWHIVVDHGSGPKVIE